MKAPLKFIKFASVFAMLIWLSACGNDDEKNNESDTLNDNVIEINDDNLITYLIPSPKDMFAFTSNGEWNACKNGST